MNDVGYDCNKEKVHKFSVTKCPEKLKKNRAINSLKLSCKYSYPNYTIFNYINVVGVHMIDFLQCNY